MGGLEKIIESIIGEAEVKADEIISDAKKTVDEIYAESEQNKEKIIEESTILTQEECMKISKKTEAEAEAEARRIILSAKRNAIEEILKQIKEKIKNAPSKEYFDLLVKLAKANREEMAGEMFFGKKDLEILPKDFSEKINEGLQNGSITIADKPLDIDGGFIIKYGKVDINCSIESIFEDKKNELSDIITEII